MNQKSMVSQNNDKATYSSEFWAIVAAHLHLFFLRIMKEHCLFLQSSYTPKNSTQAEQTGLFQKRYDALLSSTIQAAAGIVSPEVMHTEQFTTPYTLQAERLTSFYTGIPINSALTEAQQQLKGGNRPSPEQIKRLADISTQAESLTRELVAFEQQIYSAVEDCRIFTLMYPSNVHHHIMESQEYLRLLALLSEGRSFIQPENFIQLLRFWNEIMKEHAEFTAGLLDPKEESSIRAARMFAEEFSRLKKESDQLEVNSPRIAGVVAETLKAVQELKKFQIKGLTGLIGCNVRSIILPLLVDHILRESNYFIWVLKHGKAEQKRTLPAFHYNE